MWNPDGWLVDSHCHIDMPQFDARPRRGGGAGARGRASRTMLVVGGVDEERALARALRVAEELRAAGLGGRPSARGAAGRRERVYDELRGLAREKRIVAIGEIGLDFHYDHSPRDVAARGVPAPGPAGARGGPARSSFTRARPTTRRPRSWRRRARGETGGVIHCFTGGHELARRALALGFYISFSGILAFPRAEVIQEVARDVPARPAAGGDGRALPGAAAAPREAQRAGVRGRGRAQARGASRGERARRSGRGARNYAQLFRRSSDALQASVLQSGV